MPAVVCYCWRMALKSDRVTVRLDRQLAEDIRREAAQKDVPEAQIARKWLKAGRDKARDMVAGQVKSSRA